MRGRPARRPCVCFLDACFFTCVSRQRVSSACLVSVCCVHVCLVNVCFVHVCVPSLYSHKTGNPNSPWRDRPISENLREFENMRLGMYAKGEYVPMFL